MSSITSGNDEQYADSRKLAARARLASHYTVAETPWFEWIAPQLPLEAGAAVLDIGCGPGWFWATTAALMPSGLRLTLADLSPGMIEEAMDRCRDLPLGAVSGQTADAATLPFADGSFNAVIAMHMLYHVPDPAATIAEAYRVLTPGGFLAVTTNGIGNMREIYALTTLLGGTPTDPAAAAFGLDDAERLMRRQFGNVTMTQHPSHMRVTETEDLILAMTSFPPGDRAGAAALSAFRAAVQEAFARGGGAIESRKEVALFVSTKTI